MHRTSGIRAAALALPNAARDSLPAAALALSLLAATAPRALPGAPLPTAQTAPLLDNEAAFVIEARPRSLHGQASLLRSLLLLSPQAAASVGGAQSSLGLDFLDERSLERMGIDSDAPLIISGFAIDRADVDAAYRSARGALARRDWKGLHGLRAVFYRHRVAARVADPVRLGRFLAEEERGPLEPLAPAALRQAFRLDKKAAADLLGSLDRMGVVAVGPLPGDGVVIVRITPDGWIVADFLQPWLGVRPSPTDLLRAIARLSPASHAPPRSPAPAGPASDAVSLHVNGSALAGLAEATLRERALVEVPREPRENRALALERADERIATCRDLLQGGLASSLLGDLSFSLRVSPEALEASLSWPVRRELPPALALRDDRSVSLEHAARSALAVFQARIDVGALPMLVMRDNPRGENLADFASRLNSCGPIASLLASVRFWPERLALLVSQADAPGGALAAPDEEPQSHARDARRGSAGRNYALRQGGSSLRGVGNVTLVLLEARGAAPRLLFIASLDPDAAASFRRLGRAGRRVHVARAPVPGGRLVGVLAEDERTLALGRRLAASRDQAGERNRPLAEARLDASRLLRGLSPDGADDSLLRLLLARLGSARAEMRVVDGTLSVEARFQVR